MKLKSKKIRAFTITELLIVMTITSIIVGLALGILKMLQRHNNDLTNYNFKKNNLTLIYEKLSFNFKKYNDIQWNDKEDKLMFSNPIESEKVILTSDSIASFKVQLKERKFYFLGEKIVNGKIDAMSLVFDIKGKEETIFVYKRNDLKTLIDNGN